MEVDDTLGTWHVREGEYLSETLVVAGLLKAPETLPVVLKSIQSGDFADPACRVFVACAAALHARGEIVDEASLVTELWRVSPHNAFGIAEEWQRLSDLGNAHSGLMYAPIVARNAALRKTFRWASGIAQKARTATSVDDIDFSPPDVVHPKKSRFRLIDNRVFSESEFSVEWLVTGLLVRSQPCILAGGKKSLKTSLAVALALRLAVGGQLFGKFNVNRAWRVGIFSGESGGATLQETARAIAVSMGWSLGMIEGLFWCFDLPQLSDPQDLLSLKSIVTDNRLDVLILDPAYLMMGSGTDAGNLFSVGDILRGLSALCIETGCTPILLHHTTKKRANGFDPYAPPELEDIAWAGFQEWARQWWLVGRRERYDPELTGTHKLWLNLGGSAGHSALYGLDVEQGSHDHDFGRRWEIEVRKPSEIRRESREEAEHRKEAAKEQRQLDKEQRDKNAVIELLKVGPDTKTGLKKKLSWNATRLNETISNLLDDKQIKRVDITKNRRTEQGFEVDSTREDSMGLGGESPSADGRGDSLSLGESPEGSTHLSHVDDQQDKSHRDDVVDPETDRFSHIFTET